MSSSRDGPVADRGEVEDRGDVLIAAAGVTPDLLVNADDFDAVYAVGVVDQDASALVEHGVVGGVPRHRQGLREAGDGERLGPGTDAPTATP